jgi:hypothetical protein
MARKPDSSRTLAEAREGFYSVPTVPFNVHLGIVFEREQSGESRISLPPKPEILGPDGQHSVAAVYTLGDVASAVQACDAIWPRAADLGMVPLLLTTWAHFRSRLPARGTVSAVTNLVGDLDQALGEATGPRKATIEITADLFAEDGVQVGDYRTRIYARLMERSRARALAESVSEIVDLSPGIADLMRP